MTSNSYLQLTFDAFQSTQLSQTQTQEPDEVRSVSTPQKYLDGRWETSQTANRESLVQPQQTFSLPGLYDTNLELSEHFPDDTPDFFDPKSIPFEIEVDPNEALWQQVKSGQIDREYILSSYKSLGQTFKLENNRGFADLAKKRELNYQQHFTPAPITKFLAQALGLDRIEAPVTVMDNSCGIGKVFQFLSPECRIMGIEIEEKAYHMARALFPSANIINDSLIHHPYVAADYYIINPPFSIQLEEKNCGFENAGWGDLGPGSSIKSHIAAMEAAIRGARYYVAAMLPEGYFTNEETLTFERWVNQRAQLVYRLDIEGEAFTEYGFTWPCSVVIYRIGGYARHEPIHHKTSSIDDEFLQHELILWKSTEAWREIQGTLEYLRKRENFPQSNLRKHVPEPEPIPKVTLPLRGTNEVKLCLSPDASRINIKLDNLLAALKIQELRVKMGKQWNEGLQDYTWDADVMLRRKNLFENPSDIANIMLDLERANLKPILDLQVMKWLAKKKRWLARQRAPFEQYIKKGEDWTCLHENDGIKTLYPDLYKERLRRMDRLGIDWLWPFQKEDVARMSLKNTNLMCWEMGLGKTRGIIALALLYGVKHSLIVVEPKLKAEFIKEFKNLGIKDYQVIEEEEHLKTLKRFNLIAYNLLWRPLNDHTKRTFAKALRRRFQFIAIDEAHRIKAKDSEQAKAVRMLKARYKLLSTGTPIANYPRNIFSLLVFGWGDATELNPYGYYNPIKRMDEVGYESGYTTGTRQFKTDFVTIEWVTPQFAQTLDTGAKAREMPKIRDPEKWWSMMCCKIIRRQKEEPEVKNYVTFPEPEIHTELLKMSPEQVSHYKYWLDNFASWFKEQLRMEKEEGHKIDQMMVLAHLTTLQFASTIPQSPKTNTIDAPWNYGLTTKQQRTVELVREALANNEKIIVFSERPEFQRFIQGELKKYRVGSHLFIGQQGIRERNIILDDFRNNSTNVLLATTSCGETGLNIPEANVVVIADTSWTPSRQKQAMHRILRPQQKRKPRIYLLRSYGTIDQYMQQLMDAKEEAIKEGIDYQEAGEFDPSRWFSYRDFTIKMLREEGYKL